MAWVHERLVIVRFGRMGASGQQAQGCHLFHRDAYRQSSVNFEVFDFRDLAVLFDRPEFFEDFVELLFVGHGENFLIGNLAVMQLDSAIGQAGHDGIVRDHHDGAALAVQFSQQAQNDFFVDRVQIARRLVGQNDFGIVDQGARDANPLLLATGKLRGQVMGPLFQADVGQCVPGLPARRSCCGSTGPA